MASIGAELTKAMEERGVSAKQLAKHLHVTPASISMVETGELEPSDGLLRMLRGWIADGRGVGTSAPRPMRANYR